MALKSKAPKKNKKLKLKWSHLLFLSILLLLVVGISTVSTIIIAAVTDMPPLDDSDITNYNVTSYILDNNDEYVDKLSSANNHIPIEYKEISPNMIKAIVSIEDKRFYKHHGVDLIRIAGAFYSNLKAGHIVQGGSTITQQLAGLAMLDRNEKSYRRKIQEAVLSLKIERKFTKEEIISSYLNRCYFGIGNSGMSCYGIEAASNDIFGKHAKDLSIDEAALLAGMIQNPGGHSPLTNPENAIARRHQVLQAMQRNHYIKKDTFEQCDKAPLQLSTISVNKSTEKKSSNQSYVDFVIMEALDKLGLEKDAKKLYTGGYIIHTRLDQELQQYMYDYFNNDAYFPGGSSSAPLQGAMIVMDAKTGGISGLIGGRHIDENQQRGLNRAVQSKRQPGSAFKPIFVYGPAFEKGYGTGSVFKDAPYRTSGGHSIKNADLQYHGNVTIRQAIAFSYNTVAVRVLEAVGVEESMKFAQKLGISTLVTEGEHNDYTLSAGIGGLTHGVTVLDMAGAYGAFADGGVYTKPNVIKKITDENGKIIWEEKAERHRAMSPQTSYLMTSCLKSVVYEGIGSPAAIGNRVVAGKTGTTDNNKDFWFAGYSPQLVGVVWLGYDQPAPMYGTSSNAASVFRSVMTFAHRNLPVENFSQPDGVVDVLVDTKAGQLATRSTPDPLKHVETYTAGTEPSSYSNENHTEYHAAEARKKEENNNNASQQGQQNNNAGTQTNSGQGAPAAPATPNNEATATPAP